VSTPVGAYRPVVEAGPWLVCSGQLGFEPPGVGDGGRRLAGDASAQVTRALEAARRLLAEHGATPEDVVKTTVFLADISDFTDVDRAYAAFFGDHRPARSMVGVAALPLGARVEVEVWAYRAGDTTG
jgi:2-iminobutanoate/2-iminopropanoate deaminase